MSLLTTKTTIRFLLDENVPIKIGSFLESKGYNVFLTPKGLKNGQVVTFAHKETLTPSVALYGIIVFRIHPPHVEKLCASLEKMLRYVTKFRNKRYEFYNRLQPHLIKCGDEKTEKADRV